MALFAQEEETGDDFEENTNLTRLERKAIGYEHNIKKIKTQGRDLLEEDSPNYTKLEKLTRKIKKLSTKAQNCRYRSKKKHHLKIQDRATKKRTKKALKAHKKIKSNRRDFL